MPSISTSTTRSSSSSSGRPGAARPRRCAWSPGSRRSRRARSRSATESSTTLPPKERDIAMVFQNYALYPHMSVFDNMAFGLKLQKMPKAEIDERVRDAAARILGLSELLGRKPKALSGGQRQRVAMGRAIVRNPQAFLMDEPLSNLDAKLRVQMRSEIARIQARPRCHDDLRDARPDRGDDDGRPRRRAPQGRAAAGRHAADVVRASGERVRRRLHRLAGDEPRRRDAHAHERRRSSWRSAASVSPFPTKSSRRGPACAATSAARSCSASGPKTWRTRRSWPTRPPSVASPSTVELREALGSDVVVHFTIDAPPSDDR